MSSSDTSAGRGGGGGGGGGSAFPSFFLFFVFLNDFHCVVFIQRIFLVSLSTLIFLLHVF
jgi:hypothetical protein